MTEQHTDDIVLKFGPGGKYALYIPVKDVENTSITGRSFVEAGMALILYARQQGDEAKPVASQKLFDWMRSYPEKVA